jgi:hypothetical protein
MFLKLQYIKSPQLPLPGQILGFYYQGTHLMLYPYQLGQEQQVLCFVPSFFRPEFIEDMHLIGQAFPRPQTGATIIHQGSFFEGLYFVHYWSGCLTGPVVFEIPKELGNAIKITPSMILPSAGWFLPHEIATFEGIETQGVPVRLIASWMGGAIESIESLRDRWKDKECLWI